VSDEDFEPEEGSHDDGADDEGGVSLQELVEVVARTLADEPERVVVTETDHRGVTLVELTMAPDDLGRVIVAAELVGIKAQLEFHEARR
jgi:hypothetical protein